MKNKRNKIVDFFKIGVILFSVSLLLWNCEKDEILLQEQIKEIEGKYINLLELQTTNKEVSSKIEKFVNENNRSSKSIINTNYGFSINTSKILQIEENDYISFTFEAYKEVINEKDLYNFVLVKHIDGSFNQYLLSYPINTKGFIEVDLAKIEVIKSPELLLKGCEVKEVATIEEDTSSCVYLKCTGGGNHLYGQECDAPSNMQPQRIYNLATIETTVTDCESSTGGTGGSTDTTEPIGTSSSNTTSTETTTAPVYLLPKGFSLSLTMEEKQWLYAEENEEERNKIAFFLDTNKNSDNTYPEEAINFAKGQIELSTIADKFSETDPIKIQLNYNPGKINGRDEQKYTHIGTDGIRTYYKMEDGSIVLASLDELTLNSNGKLASKFTSEANNTLYYYIKPNGATEWANYLIKERINTADELETLFKLAGLELGKTLGRYVLPIEDIKILIDGKDFDGQDVARWKAAGGILLTVVPGGKIVGTGAKVLKPVIKITKETKVWKVVIKNGSKTYTRIVRELTEETLAHFEKYAPGTRNLIDDALRTG